MTRKAVERKVTLAVTDHLFYWYSTVQKLLITPRHFSKTIALGFVIDISSNLAIRIYSVAQEELKILKTCKSLNEHVHATRSPSYLPSTDKLKTEANATAQNIPFLV